MTFIDWTIIAVFLIGLTLIGFLFSKSNRNLEDYFLGGRSMPTWLVAFAATGTSISAGTLVGSPELGFNTNLTYLMLCVGAILGGTLVALLVLPKLYNANTITIYGYLGDRFGDSAKNSSSVMFLVGQLFTSGSRLFIAVGVRRENMIFCDSQGVVTTYRTDINEIKREFATTRRITTLAEAIHDADVFLGVSKADVLTPEMLRTMATNPIVMALANPDPEIAYDKAVVSRPDIIFATGRSDYPNQVNNVLGFPYIFRGALDVRATKINEAMKLAAARALAELAQEPVPSMVLRAYALGKLEFGRGYLIPKPLDPRLLCTVTPAVARAAIESGVARQPITDWDAYIEKLRTMTEI